MEGERFSGFTLVELMVVIVIVGLLAAIAIPNYVRVVSKAREAEVESNMHSVQFEVEMYTVDKGYKLYPSSVNLIKGELPGNIKNPFNPSAPAVQDEPGADMEGVVEYKSIAPFDSYTITGFGKDIKSLMLTIHEGV